MVEHVIGNDGVAGSIPALSTILVEGVVACLLPANAAGKNFIDISAYGDVRGFATITPSIKLDLPYNFSYFSFTNLDFHSDGEVYRYYTEQDLYLQIDHSDGFDMGFEPFYIIKILPKLFKDRVYLSGFVDHNLEYGELAHNHSIAVTENQIGVKLVDDLFLVAELRYNGYLPSQQLGLGIGLEYFKNF